MAYDDSSYDGGLHSQAIHDGQKIGVAIAPVSSTTRRISSNSFPALPPYQSNFFSRNATVAAARKQYLKILVGGIVMTTLAIFTIFSILWGAFYRTPAHNLPGWIIVRALYYHD